MFTGLIEHIGEIKSIASNADGARLQVDIGFLSEDCQLGDSIAVDGCCLTAIQLKGSVASFDAVPETLRRTTLGTLKAGDPVNLERSLLPTKRLGGHFVQGHIDGTATVEKTESGGKWAEWHFKLNAPDLAIYFVEKGSVAIDGISLTIAGCTKDQFWVALIPETLDKTTIGKKTTGKQVNIETDILGRYIYSMLKREGSAFQKSDGNLQSNITEAWLKERGF